MKNKKNKYPFANEIKKMKDNFKRMIDSMSDDEFLDFIEYINACSNISDKNYDEELWTGDEGWEDEAAKFYVYYAFYFLFLFIFKSNFPIIE